MSTNEAFADYYKRLSQPVRLVSPTKRDLKADATASGDEAKRPSRRKSARSPTKLTKDEVESTTYVISLLFLTLCARSGFGRVAFGFLLHCDRPRTDCDITEMRPILLI